ncbi:MAG: VIT1/CCC1 transporter family protein [Anaerolineales bacterium]|uniref:VIT1/CCC1 family protein n=1 Tax=Candidatus Villigracilis proximus TaxID=3140683 RepID=UPI0031373F16|nr:VIT1/CCC1 transporter family protein [Anaerolineales bacterium]
MSNSKDIQRYLTNRQKEIDGAALYLALADSEKQSQMAELYRRLSASEEKHAAVWDKKLEALHAAIPPRMPSHRTRILIWLAKRFGPQFILPTITGNEKADSNAYDGQPDEEAQTFSRDEKSHARMLSIAANSTGGISGGSVAQLEGRHRAGGGNALRAAVLGANDGLVSILSLVMGVAGATNSNSAVLIAGLAGLLAGAGSMALGEWLSVQSSRELYENQIKIEAEEIAETPEEEQEELALIYQSKGLPEDRARELASHMMADKGSILDTLAREELGIDPEELGGSAYEAAFTSFFLFAVGAVFPIFPFFFWSGITAIYLSLAISGIGLFIIGAGITLMTGRSIWFSGTRQVLVGLAASILTFGIGKLIGVIELTWRSQSKDIAH